MKEHKKSQLKKWINKSKYSFISHVQGLEVTLTQNENYPIIIERNNKIKTNDVVQKRTRREEKRR